MCTALSYRLLHLGSFLTGCQGNLQCLPCHIVWISVIFKSYFTTMETFSKVLLLVELFMICASKDGFVSFENLATFESKMKDNLLLNCEDHYFSVSNIGECSAMCLQPQSPLWTKFSLNLALHTCDAFLFEENATLNCMLCLLNNTQPDKSEVSDDKESQQFLRVPRLRGNVAPVQL